MTGRRRGCQGDAAEPFHRASAMRKSGVVSDL